MNNKGQILVIFVIMLPIFLILLTFVIDLGLVSIEKRNISNNTYDCVEYYLNNKDDENIEDKIKSLLNKNINNIDNIKINNTDEYIEITVSKKHKSLYSVISNNYDIKITYKGIKESNEIIKG